LLPALQVESFCALQSGMTSGSADQHRYAARAEWMDMDDGMSIGRLDGGEKTGVSQAVTWYVAEATWLLRDAAPPMTHPIALTVTSELTVSVTTAADVPDAALLPHSVPINTPRAPLPASSASVPQAGIPPSSRAHTASAPPEVTVIACGLSTVLPEPIEKTGRFAAVSSNGDAISGVSSPPTSEYTAALNDPAGLGLVTPTHCT
jgi:hypothetical protein